VSEFEKLRNRLRQIGGESDPYGGSDEVTGLLAVAEGLAEVIALLKPLVEAVTAKPELLKLRPIISDWVLCLASDPSSGGFRRCSERAGHDGDHRHSSPMSSVEYVWTQRHGDVPSRTDCDDLHQFATEHKPRRCVLSAEHTGVHTDGDEGRFW
jgi:hypothetical protein